MPLVAAGPVKRTPPTQRSAHYTAPSDVKSIAISELLTEIGRAAPTQRQMEMLAPARRLEVPPLVHWAGNLSLLHSRSVSIVGTREATEAGRLRAARLARELAEAGVVVVSGLALGIDTAALASAMQHHGHVAAVIGTPLSKAYPAENGPLQERIWREHVLLTPFAEGETVFRSNFPKRNRVMAAVSDATVIVEASDTSGTLHQAAECQRLGRWLFILQSVAEDRALKWPASFLGKPKTAVLERTEDIVAAIRQ